MDKEVTVAWHGNGVCGGAFYGDVGVAAFSAGDYFAGGSGLPYQFDNLMYYFVQPRNPADSAFYNVPLSFQVESPLPEP